MSQVSESVSKSVNGGFMLCRHLSPSLGQLVVSMVIQSGDDDNNGDGKRGEKTEKKQ